MCGDKPLRDWSPQAELIERACSHLGPVTSFVGDTWRLLSYGALVSPPSSDEQRSPLAIVRGELFQVAGEKSSNQTTLLDRAIERFQQRGVEFFGEVDGVASLVLYEPAERRLICYRDRVGQVELVFARAEDAIIIASRPSLILASRLIPREVNTAVLPEYFAYRHVSGEQTLFSGIYRVPPAYRFERQDGKEQVTRYWCLNFEPIEGRREAELVAQVDDALLTVLRKFSIRGPIANTLSGGVDSSVLQVLAQEVQGGPVRSFAYGFEEREFDDSEYAESAARQLGARHTTFQLDPRAYCSSLPEAIFRVEYPVHLEQSVSATWMYNLISAEGDAPRTMLSGYGADLNFGESLRKFRLALMLNRHVGSWTRTPISWLGAAPLRRLRYYAGVIPHLQEALSNHDSLLPVLGDIDPTVSLTAIGQIFPHANLEDMLTFRRTVLREHPSARTIIDECFLLSLVAMAAAISIWGRVADASGVSLRFPFADPEFLQLSVRIPVRQKLQRWGLVPKPLMMKLAVLRIGSQLTYRRKRTGQIQVERWYKDPNLLGRFLEAARASNFFDTERIIALGYGPGKYDNLLLWNLMNFHLWHEIFIRGRDHKSLGVLS